MTTEALTKTTVDCSTGEVTIEPLTADEIADKEQRHAEYEAREQAREEQRLRLADLKNSAKAKLVAGEPLTEEEASVLVI